MNRFKPVEPRWTPRSFASARAAWEGPHPERPGRDDARRGGVLPRTAGRASGGSDRGRSRPVIPRARRRRPPASIVFQGLLLLLLLGEHRARAPQRAARAEATGAARCRLAAVIILPRRRCGPWARTTSPRPTRAGSSSTASCNAVGMGLGFWLLYLALEPFARRRWPQMLISWTRALSGSWRDPLVGRDMLIGAAVGTAAGLIMGPLRVLLPLAARPSRPSAAPLRRRGPSARGAPWPGVLADVSRRVLGSRNRFPADPGAPDRAPRVARGVSLVTLLFSGDLSGRARARRDASAGVRLGGILVAVTVRFGILAGDRRGDLPAHLRLPHLQQRSVELGLLRGDDRGRRGSALAWWAARTALAGRSALRELGPRGAGGREEAEPAPTASPPSARGATPGPRDTCRRRPRARAR